MAAYNILQLNAVCASNTACGDITLRDNNDWTADWQPGDVTPLWTDPVANIDTVDISVTYDGVVYDLTQYADYNSGIYTIAPTDVGQTGDTFADGIYTITVVYTDLEGSPNTHTYSFSTLLTCAVDCTIDTLVHEIASRECLDCNQEEIGIIACLVAYKTALCSAFKCNNFTQAENILAWLEDLLINYNCNNC